MDMQWLDDVLLLLEEGNMTRAAARRNITQPAFSRRIRGFEDWLGVTVLQRGTNRVDISAALVSNEVEIRALVARLKDLRAKIAHFDPASSTVSIAAQHAPIFLRFLTWLCGRNIISHRSSFDCEPEICTIASQCFCAAIPAFYFVTSLTTPALYPLGPRSDAKFGVATI